MNIGCHLEVMLPGLGAAEGSRRQLNFGIPYSTSGPSKVDLCKNQMKFIFLFDVLACENINLLCILNAMAFRIAETIVVLFVATAEQNRDRVVTFSIWGRKTIVRCFNFESAFYRLIKNS